MIKTLKGAIEKNTNITIEILKQFAFGSHQYYLSRLCMHLQKSMIYIDFFFII